MPIHVVRKVKPTRWPPRPPMPKVQKCVAHANSTTEVDEWDRGLKFILIPVHVV